MDTGSPGTTHTVSVRFAGAQTLISCCRRSPRRGVDGDNAGANRNEADAKMLARISVEAARRIDPHIIEPTAMKRDPAANR